MDNIILSWIGAASILGAYSLIHIFKWSVKSLLHLSLNFWGASALTLSAYQNHAYAFVLLNIFGAAIALYSIFQEIKLTIYP